MLGKFVWLFKSVAFWFSSMWPFSEKLQKNQEYLQYQKVWIQIRSNVCWALFARNVKPDLDPKLFWLTLADEELTGFFIFVAFYLL